MARSFPVDEAQIVALFMECIVYGIYLVTLGMTIRALVWDSTGERKKLNWPMFIVMSLMAIFATLDVSFGLKHNLDAFIFYMGPGGADEEFANISYWVNVMKTVDTQILSLIGDGMLIYRCSIVYGHRWWVTILPTLMWLAGLACTVIIIWYTATLQQDTVLSTTHSLQPWIYSFLSITFALNIITTGLIILKIWKTNKKSAPYITHASGKRFSRAPQTRLENVIRIILESGLLYTVNALATLICAVTQSNAIYGVSDVMNIVVGISFNLIIIRVDRASGSFELSHSGIPSNGHPLRLMRSSMGPEVSQRGVEITISREVAFDTSTSIGDSDDKRTDGSSISKPGAPWEDSV